MFSEKKVYCDFQDKVRNSINQEDENLQKVKDTKIIVFTIACS